MAVTCKWEALLGEATLTYQANTENEFKQKINIYGGGNCLAVFCYENKNLYNFWIDNEHVKNVAKDNVEYLTENLSEIKIFIHTDKQYKKEALNVAKVLLTYGIEFSYVKLEKEQEV